MILRSAHPCNGQRAKRPLELANDTMEAANALVDGYEDGKEEALCSAVARQRQTKFSAWSMDPLPLYCAIAGYAHRGRVRTTLPLLT